MIGSAIGGIFQANAAESAAKAQTKAAKKSAKTQLKMYERSRKDLAPFFEGGAATFDNLLTKLPQFSASFTPTVAELENTPGYQFTRDQGLKTVANAYAAKGLGSSGAALKGAADYATGLADSTWRSRFDEDLRQKQQQYGMYLGPATVGQNAAAGAATVGQNAAAGAGSAYIGAGNAQAASTIAQGNIWGNLASNTGALLTAPFTRNYLTTGSFFT